MTKVLPEAVCSSHAAPLPILLSQPDGETCVSQIWRPDDGDLSSTTIAPPWPVMPINLKVSPVYSALH